MLSLPKNTRNSQRSARTSPQCNPQIFHRKPTYTPQPDLFNSQPTQDKEPTQPVFVRPADKSHHGREGYFFQIHCSYGNGQFGGLYSRTECDRILELLSPLRAPVEPRSFGLAAEQAIKEARGVTA